MHFGTIKNSEEARRGQAAFITVLFTIGLSAIVAFGFSLIAVRETRVNRINREANQSYFLAEAAIEDAYYRIQQSMTRDATETLSIDGLSASVAVTQPTAEEYELTSEGNVSSAIRRISMRLHKGIGASFVYGAQVGYLGIHLENSQSRVTGSVFSNGPVSARNLGTIEGDAWVATKPSLDQEQPNQSTEIAYADTGPRLDYAQSFIPSVTAYAKHITIWIRKIGTPPNGSITVRILADDGTGKPEINGISFGSGSISRSSVGATTAEIPVVLVQSQPLTDSSHNSAELDSSNANALNYYKIAADVEGSYAIGTSQWSGDWGAPSPSWTPTDLDAKFAVHLNTDANDISGTNQGIIITGDAHAPLISPGVNICGNAYYTTTIAPDSETFLNDPTPQLCPPPLDTDGTAFSATAAPPPPDMPLTLSEITDLVEGADNGGTYTGNLILGNNESATIGPTKITGYVSLDSGSVLEVTGDLHVMGDFTCSQGTVRLDSSYGAGSGVIIVDGASSLGNSCEFTTETGNPSSYIMLLSRYPASASGDAIHLKNLGSFGNRAIIYAHFGEVSLENQLRIAQVTGAQVNLMNDADVIYEVGLTNVKFTSGPTGGWGVLYWREIE